MEMSLDWKCSITTAILAVLVYILLLNVFGNVWGESSVGQEMNKSADWYKSMEVIMLGSVFLAYHLNNMLFSACRV
jgi:hypothetical protein